MSSSTDPSRRRGKFRELVNTCQALLAEDGLAVTVAELEQLLAGQITAVATQTGVTEQTALRTYFGRTWARRTADRLVADTAAELDPREACPDEVGADEVGAGTHDEQARVVELGLIDLLSVIAILGDVQLYAVINTGHADPAESDTDTAPALTARRRTRRAGTHPAARAGSRYDPVAAAGATSGLALEAGVALARDPGTASVWVAPVVARAALRALVAFEACLGDGLWQLCSCCAPEEQAAPIAALQARIRTDREGLERSLAAAAAAQAAQPMQVAKVLPMRRATRRRDPEPPTPA